MKPFRVSWSIEVDAENDVDAALLADRIMKTPEHRKTIADASKFEVTEIGTIDTTIIDLSDSDVVEFHNVEDE